MSWSQSRNKAVVLMSVAALAAACSPGETSGDSSTVLRIGLIADTSGTFSATGQSVQRGVELAVEEINADGAKIELHACNAQSDPLVARTCYNQLVRRNRVQVIIGPDSTVQMSELAQLMDKDGILNFNETGGFGGESQNGLPTIFSAMPSSQESTGAVWNWAKSTGNTKGFMIVQADAAGDGCRDFFTNDLYADYRDGIDYLGSVDISANATTAAPQVARVPAEADFLYVCTAGPVGLAISTAAEQSGLRARVILNYGTALPSFAKSLESTVASGSVYATVFCTAVAKDLPSASPCAEAASRFLDAFSAKYPDAVPDTFSSTAYDSVHLALRAFEAAGSSAADMSAWLESAGPIPGVTGTYQFAEGRHRGLRAKDFAMASAQNGVWTLVDPMALAG